MEACDAVQLLRTVICPSIFANKISIYRNWRDERARVKQPTSTLMLGGYLQYHIHGEIQGTLIVEFWGCGLSSPEIHNLPEILFLDGTAHGDWETWGSYGILTSCLSWTGCSESCCDLQRARTAIRSRSVHVQPPSRSTAQTSVFGHSLAAPAPCTAA